MLSHGRRGPTSSPLVATIVCASELLNQLSVDTAEIYSPPRDTAEASKFGMELLMEWCFAKKEHQEAAKKYVEKHDSKLLIVHRKPMCTMFSFSRSAGGERSGNN